jgi:hypothetical protein
MFLSKPAILIAVLTLAASHSLAAQSTTGFKKGEQTTGMTKQCFYDVLGSGYTMTVASYEICPVTVQVASPVTPKASVPSYPTGGERQPYTTGFKKGEQITGMTKQCFYDVLGSAYTKTIASYEVCPVTVQVRFP